MDKKMLGTEKIGSLLMKLSVPAIFAMLVNGLYNVVDTIFISNGVGTDAIGGLAVAFPFQMLIMAVGLTIGTGAASIVSRALGEKNYEKASNASGTALTMSLVFGVIFMFIGLAALEPILYLFGATDTLIVYAKEYMNIILLGSVFITSSMTANNIIRSEGKAMIAMLTMLIGTVVNIPLDWLFIYPFKMGIAGAALATVIGQGLSFLFVTWYFARGKSFIHMHIKSFMPDWGLLYETFILGVPALFRQFGMSLLAIVVNNALGAYGGDLYISTYGIIQRLLMFVFMPLFGIVQGFQPIAGYNYGAKQYDRVQKLFTVSNVVTTIYGVFFFIIMTFFPTALLSIFTQDFSVLVLGTPAIRMLVLAIPLIGIQIIGATLFQAIGKAVPSLLLSMSRQVLLLIPLVVLLPIIWGVNGIWLAFPVADVLATLITVGFVVYEMRLMKNTLGTVSE